MRGGMPRKALFLDDPFEELFRVEPHPLQIVAQAA